MANENCGKKKKTSLNRIRLDNINPSVKTGLRVLRCAYQCASQFYVDCWARLIHLLLQVEADSEKMNARARC